jgi:hypothetical protein
VVVHRAFGCAQVLYLSIRRIRDPRGTWVVSLYVSMVLGYIETGECIVLIHDRGVGSRS